MDRVSPVIMKCPSLWSRVPSLYHVIFGLGSPDAIHWNEAGEDWFTVILTGPASRETGTEIKRNQSEIKVTGFSCLTGNVMSSASLVMSESV